MKILWFINNLSSYSNKINLNSVGGAWISSLEEKFRNSFSGELRLAFHYGNEYRKDTYNGNTYYLLSEFSSNNGFNRIIRKWRKKYFDLAFVKSQYLRVVRDYNPDIIQIFGSENPYGLIIPHVDTPVILHIQGNLNVINLKYFSGFSLKEIRSKVTFKEFIDILVHIIAIIDTRKG